MCTATIQIAWALRPLLGWAYFHPGEWTCSSQLTWALAAVLAGYAWVSSAPGGDFFLCFFCHLSNWLLFPFTTKIHSPGLTHLPSAKAPSRRIINKLLRFRPSCSQALCSSLWWDGKENCEKKARPRRLTQREFNITAKRDTRDQGEQHMAHPVSDGEADLDPAGLAQPPPLHHSHLLRAAGCGIPMSGSSMAPTTF